MSERRGKNQSGAGYATISGRIPKDVKTEFRIACLRDELSVNEALERLCAAYATGAISLGDLPPARAFESDDDSDPATATPTATGLYLPPRSAMTPEDYKRIRSAIDMTQKGISRALETDATMWGKYERGINQISRENYEALARLLEARDA